MYALAYEKSKELKFLICLSIKRHILTEQVKFIGIGSRFFAAVLSGQPENACNENGQKN
jgi:hypothetical protein